MNVVYVTGNAHKAKYFAQMVGLDIPNVDLEVDEIQSLHLREIVEYKARQAYEKLKQPVIVEDTKLIFTAMGALPGPFIKYFLEELGPEKLCRLLDGFDDRSAVAGAAIAYYDGVNMEIFEKEIAGEITKKPIGDSGFGWNRIFSPKGSNITLGEMTDREFVTWYAKVKPFKELRDFLTQK